MKSILIASFIKIFLMVVLVIIVLAALWFILTLFTSSDKKTGAVREKYGVAGEDDRQARKDIAESLLKKAYDALQQDDYETAFTYMKDSFYLDSKGKWQILYSKYYYATGDSQQGYHYLMEARKKGIAEYWVIEAAKRLERDDLYYSNEWCQRALENNAYGAKELKEKIEKRENELRQQTYNEIDKVIKEIQPEIANADKTYTNQQDYLAAAEIYTTAYKNLKKTAICKSTYGDNVTITYPQSYSDTLVLLSTKAALMYYKESCNKIEYYSANEYNEAKRIESYEWLTKEDNNNLPEYYYIKAGLGYASQILKKINRTDSRPYILSMDDALKYAVKAVKFGVTEAEELKKNIIDKRAEEARRRLSVMAMEAAEERMFMEEHNGMSRDEYEEYRAEIAENRRKTDEAMAAKERKPALRSEIESKERDIDILMGGSGYTMEEKALRGEISQADYADYNYLKEKYIENED